MIDSNTSIRSLADYAYQSQSGAKYCPRTTFATTPEYFESGVPANTISAEFTHEQFHHFTSTATSTGYLLSCLSYFRLSSLVRDLRQVYAKGGSEADIRNFGIQNSTLNLSISNFMDILDSNNKDISNGCRDYVLLLMGENILLRYSELKPALSGIGIFPQTILATAVARATGMYCEKYGLKPSWIENYQTGSVFLNSLEWAEESIELISHKSMSHIDVIDIYEAYSVTAEISMIASMNSISDATERLNSLNNSRYKKVLSSVCQKLGIPYDASQITSLTPTLFALFDIALETELGCHTSWMAEGLRWADTYPPARLERALEVAKSIGPLRFGETGRTFIDFYVTIRSEFLTCRETAAVNNNFSFFNKMKEQKDNIDTIEIEFHAEVIFDPIHYYTDLYFSFLNHCEQLPSGIACQFFENELIDFKYAFPPAIFDPNGRPAFANYIPHNFLYSSYASFSFLYFCEGLYFGDTEKELFPFNFKRFDQSSEWHQGHAEIAAAYLEHLGRHTPPASKRPIVN